jgi:hypothetical protein
MMHWSRIMRGAIAIVIKGGLEHSEFLDPPLKIDMVLEHVFVSSIFAVFNKSKCSGEVSL